MEIIINKLSSVLINLIKPKSNTDINNISNKKNNDNDFNKLTGTGHFSQYQKSLNRKTFNGFDYRPKEILEVINKNHSPSSSISSIYSYNSESSSIYL
eukprot:jgi/Orpsp1_1/1186720/evm.model.d7180000052783.1